MTHQTKSYKKFVATAATATLVASALAPVASAATDFTDVSKDYKEAVDYIVNKGIAQGTTETTFGTSQNISRGDAAVMIANALKLDTENAKDAGFQDVNNRVAGAVNAIVEAGIASGRTSSKFDPAAYITRQEMAKMLANAYELTATENSGFTDVNKNWEEYVGALKEAGITLGKTETTFAPTANLTRGEFALFMFRAETMEVVLDLKSVTATDAKTLAVVLSDDSNHTVTLEKALEANKATEVTFTIDGKEYTTTVTWVVTEAKVESVSAINAKQLQVTFNQEVDAASAKNLANYFTQNATTAKTDVATSDSTAKVEVSADGKTVTITATNNVEALAAVTEEGTPFTFEVNGVKAKNGTAFPKFSNELKVEDTVAPTLLGADAKASASTKTVTLLFSEPVDPATGVYKVNGKVASVVAGPTPNTLTLTSVDSLQAGNSYSIEILNAKDFAGNILASTTSTVNVVKDASAANITSVSTVSDNTVRVTFDKAMDATTLTNSNITVINNNGTAISASDYGVSRVDSKTYDVTFTAGLYSGVNSEALTLVFNNNIKDSVGNAISTVTKTATLSKDLVAPTVKSAKVLPKGEVYDGATYANGAMVLTFDEDVVAPASIAAGSIKVIDQAGADISSLVTYGTPVLNTKDSKVLVVPFASNTITSSSTKATVKVPAAVTQDDTLGSNDNIAATFNNVDLQTPLADTVKPVVSTVAGAANNTITYNITEANLDKATVQDVNNYRLDGKPLAAGSYVTIAGTAPNHTVTVHLADGSVETSRTNYAFTISGIKDTTGNIASTVAVNNVSLTDDVKPVLKSSKINADNTFTLTFSEAVSGVVAADIEVFVNGKTTAIPSAQYNITNIASGADTGAVLVSLDLSFEDTDSTPSNGDEKLYIDVDGSGGYNASTDILLLEGTFADDTAAKTAYGSTVVDLSDLSSIKVKTAASTTGADAAGNKVKSGTLITIK